MKNLFLLLLLFSPTLLLAQADHSKGTNLDEYRFLSKGYAYQIEMGVDPFKKGYDLKTLANSENGVSYIGMYEKDPDNLKGILLIFKSKTNELIYICLPNNQASKRVWERYEMDRKAIVDPDIWETYDAAMRDLTFQIMGNAPSNQAVPAEYTDVNTDNSYKPEKAITRKVSPKEEGLTEKGGSTKLIVKGTNSKVNKQSKGATATKEINPDVNITMDAYIVNNGVVEAPVIRGLYRGRGILVIKFCFNQNGDVTEARYTMSGSTTYKSNLKQMALESVRRAKFAPSSKSEQCGKVTFRFK